MRCCYCAGPDVFPIPGTKSVSRLLENFGAVAVNLSGDEAKEVASFIDVVGDRSLDMSSTFLARL
jgi:aryl-alcohol dehydrogenase-like predicted oxidoreductase